MQHVHTRHTDSFGSLELGMRFEHRHLDVNALNITVPTVAAPQTPAPGNDPAKVGTGGAMTQADRANNGGILNDMNTRESKANSQDANEFINAVTARGFYQPQLGNKALFDDKRFGDDQHILAAVSVQTGLDLKNYTEGTDGKNVKTEDLINQLNGPDADASQSAASELARRYSAGMELRGDLDMGINVLEHDKLANVNNKDVADKDEAQIKAMTKQRDDMGGSLDNLRENIENSKDHAGALGNLAYQQLGSGQAAPDASATDQRVNQAIANGQLPEGLERTQDGHFAVKVPAGGSIWAAFDQFKLNQQDQANAVNNVIKSRNGNQNVNPGDLIPIPDDIANKIVNTDKTAPVKNTHGTAGLAKGLAWLDQTMPIGPSSTANWEPGLDPQKHYDNLANTPDHGKARLAQIVSAIGDDKTKRDNFSAVIRDLNNQFGGKIDTSGLDSPAGAPAAASGSTDGNVNRAVQHAMDGQGHLAIDGKVYTGNNYGDASNALTSKIKSLTDGGTKPQAAIDEVLSHVSSTASDKNASAITMQNLKKEIYAAYGVTAPTDRATANPLVDAVNDFNDGPGDAMWSASGNVKDAAPLRSGDADKRAGELAQLKGKSRGDVENYVRSHYFVHHTNVFGKAQSKDPAEGPLQAQMIDAVCKQLGIS